VVWTSYSLNFEDVMICRAFQDLSHGCFVDVGAFAPIESNNTYALYERGWRGIALDPQAHFIDQWRAVRPGDVFLNAAAGATAGEADFYLTPAWTQMATMRRDYADLYQGNISQVIPTRVQVLPLSNILETHLEGRDLHVLCVDVEGSERDVLGGLDLDRHRPWLMVIEATRPGTPALAHQDWEGLVLNAAYEFTYFDGLNRFYLAREHSELRRFFATPPNVWDDFISYRVVELERMLASERGQIDALARELGALRENQGRPP
jgi:FkbM family methyltransferase